MERERETASSSLARERARANAAEQAADSSSSQAEARRRQLQHDLDNAHSEVSTLYKPFTAGSVRIGVLHELWRYVVLGQASEQKLMYTCNLHRTACVCRVAQTFVVADFEGALTEAQTWSTREPPQKEHPQLGCVWVCLCV